MPPTSDVDLSQLIGKAEELGGRPSTQARCGRYVSVGHYGGRRIHRGAAGRDVCNGIAQLGMSAWANSGHSDNTSFRCGVRSIIEEELYRR
jgi:hypothetical protein